MRAMGLRTERAERLDLAPAVRLARLAHLMRPRRRAAIWAEAQPRRRDAMLGAALVATRLRRFSLGNCHRRSASIAAGRIRVGRATRRARPRAGRTSLRRARVARRSGPCRQPGRAPRRPPRETTSPARPPAPPPRPRPQDPG